METVAAGSLLDEADFLAELAGLEQGLTEKQRSADVIRELHTPIRTRPFGKFIDDPLPKEPAIPQAAAPAPVEAAPAGFSRAAAVGFFVLMTVVGAAGAALVFHDRFALLVSRIQ